MSWRCVPLGLLLLACAPTEALTLPALEGAESALLFERIDALRTTPLRVGDLSRHTVVRTAEQDSFLLTYAAPLEALELVPEVPITHDPAGPPLPTPLQALALRGLEGGWAPTDRLPEVISGFHLPLRAPADCVREGGCYGPDPSALACIECPYAATPDPPAPPEPPRFLPCPPGWDEVRGSTSTPDRCRVRTLRCAPGEVAWPSAERCTALRACPLGPYPDPLPTGPRLRFVGPDPGSTGGGLSHPDLAAALAAAAPGDHLVLSKGQHHLTQTPPPGVILEGACPAETIVLNEVPAPLPSLTLIGLTWQGGAVVGPAATVTATAAILQGALEVAGTGQLALDSGRIETTTTAKVRGDLRLSRVDWEGPGIIAWEQAEVEVIDSRLEGEEMQDGLQIHDQAQATLDRVQIGGYGVGLQLLSGQLVVDRLELRRFVSGFQVFGGRLEGRALDLADGSQIGLVAIGGGIELEDLYVADVRRNDGEGGGGFATFSPQGCPAPMITVAGARWAIHDVGPTGVLFSCAAANVDDLDVQRARSRGIELWIGEVSGSRWAVADSSREGLRLEGNQPDLATIYPLAVTLTDLEILRARGEGLSIGEESVVQIDRLRVRGARPHGLAVRAARARAEIRHASIEEIGRDGTEGSALHLAGELGAPAATLALTHFELENALHGVDLRPASEIHLTDGWIRHTSVAFRLAAAVPELRELLRGVRFSDNGQLGLR